MSADGSNAPWSRAELSLAKMSSREGDQTLLMSFGRSRLESDVARWAKLGRTDDEALVILNGKGGGGEQHPAVAAE